MTPYNHDGDDVEHIAPVYRPPQVSRGSDPISGASAGIAVCVVGFLIGWLAKGPPQWVLDGTMAFFGICLIYACRAWKRAVFDPTTIVTTSKRER